MRNSYSELKTLSLNLFIGILSVVGIFEHQKALAVKLMGKLKLTE